MRMFSQLILYREKNKVIHLLPLSLSLSLIFSFFLLLLLPVSELKTPPLVSAAHFVLLGG
jgi:hypothetical protein